MIFGTIKLVLGKEAEYFEEVETSLEYNGYFCSVPEAISIVVQGSIGRLRNPSQIHQWAESDKVSEFLKENFEIEYILWTANQSQKKPELD